MATNPQDIPNEMRDFAEKSVDQAKKAFEGYMTAAQKAAGNIETAAQAAGANAKEATSKAVAFASHNVNAAFELAQKLVAAKDIQQVFAIQSDFAKAQLAAIQAQARELAAIVQGAAPDARKK
jgi:phasin